MKEVLVSSDIDTLKQVIVQPTGGERQHIVPKFDFVKSLGFSMDITGERAEYQHENFVNILQQNGVDVLVTYDLINNSLDNLRKNGLLHDWLYQNFPEALEFASANSLDAKDVVGASDRSYFNFDSGKFKPAFRPLNGMYYTRDWAAILPEGVIITSFSGKRKAETKLARLIFEWSDQLQDIPVIFDAEKEGVSVQGGDIIVLNNNEVFLGLDNMSTRVAAKLMAQKLNINIIGVKLPNTNLGNIRDPFSSLFLHLDTTFNLIDSTKVLTIPYFFEKKYTKSNPFYDVLESIFDTVDADTKDMLVKIMKELESVGNVILFEATSGKEKETNMKLVDFVREVLGYQIISVGGDIPENPKEQTRHIIESVLPEVRFQASNVVAINPGHVIIYNDNTKETQAGLIKAGVNVLPIEGYELARWNGGPHCMTMPTRRAKK